MDENYNSMLALQLTILEKLEDTDSIVSIERQDSNLLVRNKAGKTFTVEIPSGKDGIDGKDANIDIELLQNNIIDNIKVHVDSQIKEIEVKTISEANDKFRHDQDNILNIVNEKITNVEKIVTTNIDDIKVNLDAIKTDFVSELNSRLQLVQSNINELKTVKPKNGSNGKDGKNGKDGNGILNAKLNDAGHLIIETNEKTFDLGSIQKKRRSGGMILASTGGSEFTYTNSTPMPVDVGGLLAGTTFNQMTLNELWTRLLYPYQFPEFTAFNIDLSTGYEVGNTIAAANYQTTWTIDNLEMLDPNSISITYTNTNTTLANNLANVVPYSLAVPTITFAIPTEVRFRISALNTTETTFTRDFTVNFMQRVYIGESNLDTLTEVDVKDLRSSELSANINGEYQMLAGGYKWFCYPVAMGTRSNFYDVNTNFPIAMNNPQTISITNDFGVVADYYCYRTFNMLGGVIEIGIA